MYDPLCDAVPELTMWQAVFLLCFLQIILLFLSRHNILAIIQLL